MNSTPLDEESRALLRKIVEGQAYRQLVLANIRGHGLKFIGELEAKLALAEELDLALRQFREVQRLYAELCDADVISEVRGKMERIPYPGSRLELAVCLFLCQRVERAALLAYTTSACRNLAAIALSRMEATPSEDSPRDPIFVEYCVEPSHHAHAQQLFHRWLGVALLSLGRPGSHGDARAVALKLRSRRVADIARDFLAELQPFMTKCNLSMPDAASLAIELPAEPGARAAGR